MDNGLFAHITDTYIFAHTTGTILYATMFERRGKQFPRLSSCGPCGGNTIYYLFYKTLLFNKPLYYY
jgi:hypothetical protein